MNSGGYPGSSWGTYFGVNALEPYGPPPASDSELVSALESEPRLVGGEAKDSDSELVSELEPELEPLAAVSAHPGRRALNASKWASLSSCSGDGTGGFRMMASARATSSEREESDSEPVSKLEDELKLPVSTPYGFGSAPDPASSASEVDPASFPNPEGKYPGPNDVSWGAVADAEPVNEERLVRPVSPAAVAAPGLVNAAGRMFKAAAPG